MAEYEPTPEQVTMREEMENMMEGMMHVIELNTMFDAGLAASIPGMATDVIEDAPNLVLNLTQWTIVHGMVENALRLGIAVGRIDPGTVAGTGPSQ